jgi:hypothetical protein
MCWAMHAQNHCGNKLSQLQGALELVLVLAHLHASDYNMAEVHVTIRTNGHSFFHSSIVCHGALLCSCMVVYGIGSVAWSTTLCNLETRLPTG